MAIGGQLAVDGLAQIEVTDDGGGGQVKHLLHSLLDLLVCHRAGAEGIHHDGHRPCHADGVGHLYLALLCQTRSHDVLCHPAGSVGCAAVHLAGVLAGEGAAAVACIAAVGVHDDLTAGQAGIALRAAHNKAAGGVDVVLGVLVQQLSGDGGLDDLFHHVCPQLLHAHALAVLAGDDHGVHAHGLVVLVVLHGHLALAVRAQVIHFAALAHFGQALCQLVGKADGHGHQLGGLVAGITEHHALIACTAHLIVGAQCNIGALAVNVGDDGAGVSVKAELCAGVADICHHLADDLLEVHIAVGSDLAHNVHKAGGCAGLAGHAGIGVVGQDLVQNCIRDLVADLVGMSLGDGLRSKQVSSHFLPPKCCSCVYLPFHQVCSEK